MKKLKKIFAALAASALVAAMSFTSMAASITINSGATADGIDATRYTYYQMLKASISGENVAYYVETETLANAIRGLEADLDGVGEKDALFTVSEKTVAGNRWNVTPSAKLTTLIQSGEDDKAEAAKKIAAAFKTIKGSAIKTDHFTSDNGKAKVEGLDPGYYLVESSLGTVLAVDTVGDVRITEKNAYPRDAKKVAERSVITGRNITYYITVDVPASVIDDETITVHDTFENKFSFDKMSVQVHTEKTKDVTNPLSTGINVDTAVEELADKSYANWDTVAGFELKTKNLTDGCTFEMTISQLNLYKNQSIVIRYTAQLDDVEAGKDYFNREQLTYTNYYTSKEKEAPVKTYDFNLVKTFSDSDGVKGLTAEFNLYEDTDSNGVLDLQKDLAMKLFLDGTGYIVSNRRGANTIITANKDTKLNIRGLGEGTYYLVETRTSDGYNLLAEAVKINIAADGKVTLTDGTEATDKTVTVNNEKGIRLPSTGGMGTVAFAVVGLIVMAGAAVTLIIKKRA